MGHPEQLRLERRRLPLSPDVIRDAIGWAQPKGGRAGGFSQQPRGHLDGVVAFCGLAAHAAEHPGYRERQELGLAGFGTGAMIAWVAGSGTLQNRVQPEPLAGQQG
jgi:hypothetical protein